MPTLVEIGPSNASQGQNRRKDATEQIKVFIYSVASILQCSPCEVLEGPISTRVGIV